ncbi:hypothetical protein FFF34_015780 [Inquilinus sp. KBS0705]|nr:hypothetical protein FFF34_015780 [Inquilinus sp. KBS0705]
MIRARYKKVLLVSSKPFPDQLLDGYDNVKQISAQTAIFPAIHELKPDAILFDHAHMGDNFERVLRRLQTNAFYRNIKIYCYKKQESIKADSLLKVLGVDHIIYNEDLEKVSKGKAALTAINNMVDGPLIKWVTGVAH